MMDEARLASVEPIVAVLGVTEGGDMLIEDRNGTKYSLRRSLVDDAVSTAHDESNDTALAAMVAEIDTVADEPAPEPKPKRRRARKAK